MKSKIIPKMLGVLLVLSLVLMAMPAPVAAQVYPSRVEAELWPGESLMVEKYVTTPALLPKADVVISMDLTGSMWEELDNLKVEIDDLITALAAESANLNMGVVSHKDYPHAYNYCEYSATYGGDGEWPFLVEHVVDGDFAAAAAAVAAMTASGGADAPESYARVMWESGQPENYMGYRDGAQKILVMFLDDKPHDCGYDPSTGVDPGRDEEAGTADDIDVEDDAIPSMTGAGVILLVVYSGTDPSEMSIWDTIATATGGSAVEIDPNGSIPGGISLTELIMNLIKEVKTDVWWEVESDEGLDVILSPAVYYDVSGHTKVQFNETITLDEEATPCQTYTATVTFLANKYPKDGMEIAKQEISIHARGTPQLGVTVDGPSTVYVCQNFEVKGTITNNGVQNATNVKATIQIRDNAEWVAGGDPELSDHPQFKNLIQPGQSWTATWTLHCTAEGYATIKVGAECAEAPEMVFSEPITVKQLKPKLAVDITNPGPQFVGESFPLKATVTSTGPNTNVVATIDPGAKAEWVSGGKPVAPYPIAIGDMADGDKAVVTWTLRCTSASTTGVTVNADSDQAHASDYEVVEQKAPKHPILRAVITAPTGDPPKFHPDVTFSVDATITNDGDEPALDCSATIELIDPGTGEPSTLAELVAGDSAIKKLGNIAAGATHHANWTVRCTGPGNVVINVIPAGDDDITGEAIPPSDIIPASILVYQAATEDIDVTALALVVKDELVGIGYGEDKTFQDILFYTPIVPGSLTVVAGEQTLHDNGVGGLTGDGTGTICYSNGELTVTFKCAPAKDTKVLASYKMSLPDGYAKIGTCKNFTVVATVVNSGFMKIVNIIPGMAISPSAGAHVICGPSPSKFDLDQHQSQDVTWTLHCDQAGDVTLTAGAAGTGTKTGGKFSDSISATIEQKYILVDITKPEDKVTKANDTSVNAMIYNYHSQNLKDVIAWIEIIDDPPVYLLTPPPATQTIGIIASGARAPVPTDWHLQWTGYGTATFKVFARGITAITGDTITNFDEFTIKKVEGADLDVTITEPETSHWYGRNETFNVFAEVTNNGDDPAGGVSAYLTAGGNSSILTANPVDLDGIGIGGSKTADWTVQCTGPCDVGLIVDVSGTSVSCGNDTRDSASATVHQMPLYVEVDGVDPVKVCQTFCVTARLINDSCDCTTYGYDVPGVSATINIDPATGASLADGESDTKTIGIVPRCQTQEVEWTVHCDRPGMVTITVTATTSTNPLGDGQLGYDVSTSDSITVVQLPSLLDYRLRLAKGWNYMSLPLIPEDPDITEVLIPIDGQFNEVWAYKGQEWQLYVPSAPDSFYAAVGLEKLTTMEDGVGYIIRVLNPVTLIGQGYELPTEVTVPPPEYLLLKGWNLSGFKTMDFDGDTDITNADTMKVMLYMSNLEVANPAKIVGDEARFFRTYVPGMGWRSLADTDLMLVGYGYWLYASQDGLSIVPPIER
jgi:hypothetical protein